VITNISHDYAFAPTPVRAVKTNTANESSLALTDSIRSSRRDAWEEVVDRRLVEWGRDPSLLEEDDLIPPTREAVQSAVKIVRILQQRYLPPPRRVVPDGDGGIVMERWSDHASESIEVDRRGRAELVICLDGAVLNRVAWLE
jgi:hypothetical protein